MARPKIKKFICEDPKCNEFFAKSATENCKIYLTIEEYEVIRLIDLEDMTQDECAVQMKVSRPTIQILYANARRKIADFFVNGKSIVIEGGDYTLCADTDANCMHRNKRNRCHKLD